MVAGVGMAKGPASALDDQELQRLLLLLLLLHGLRLRTQAVPSAG